MLLALVLAAVIVPAQRRLRPQVERLFFAERHAIDVGIGALLRELGAGAPPRDLVRIAAERLDALLRPEACVVYAREGSAFAAIFARGRALPPAFAADSSLATALRERAGPLVADRFAERRGELGPFDRAALQTLDAAVLLPISRNNELFAFLCLGPKRSGDIYTPTDARLLGMVAEKLSSELVHFEQAEVLREARKMQDSLRRYVPGAVAEQLAAAGDLASGEREVTVLFVDLRGYTAYAEPLRADEIFSTINRYTEVVSAIVRREGGSVVEFNGDGMMTVFGAPKALPDKERAALRAGRAIVDAVARLGSDPAAPTLSVGVGIATGEAFVGSVRSADRLIWTAIGNTTNLAARLQTLTRDLDAAIVIDAQTRDAAREVAPDFVAHPETRIRGRREPLLVYALPCALPP
jgi:class 3 adenylate cyclase